MAARETGHFRLENGMVLEMDLPLAEVYSARVKRGEIVRVNPDGSTFEDEATAAARASVAAPLEDDERAELDDLRSRVPDLEAELDLATKQLALASAEVTKLREQVAALTPPPAADATAQTPAPAKATKATSPK